MNDEFNQASWYVYALTGAADTVIDWRCIHDQRHDLPAHNFRGTLTDTWETLQHYNASGYGIFANINAIGDQQDANGRIIRDLTNVKFIRAHVADLDSLTAAADLQRATAAHASFVVQSSANKFHVYWRMDPYVGNDFYQTQQRKIVQLYNSDPKVIDATRVMRVPGFKHLKGEPLAVVCWPLPAFEHIRTAEAMAAELAHVNVIEHTSTRKPLGTAEMTAPSLEWLKLALSLVNPNDLDRSEWLSMSAAMKQAGWNHASESELYDMWQEWCAQYSGNNAGENRKLWDSIRDTETGWTTFERRTMVSAYSSFGFKDAPAPRPKMQVAAQPPATPGMPPPPPNDNSRFNVLPPDQFGEIMTDSDCQEWFKGCYFVMRHGEIFSMEGRFMGSTQFNGRYGGKQFIITSTGKVTDEPWKAALRSTCWTIPKVDHTRFLPSKAPMEIIEDEFGRKGLNTYIPARVDSVAGDVTPWLNWFDRILPDKNDQRVLIEYMAHCVKFPGYKIPWAPMLQSAEGIGKTIFYEILAHALGMSYVYTPKAPELVKSGSTFNAWMRSKLMIVVNEIKIDERRELIEILKPMITDSRVEVQSKGVDQEMEDNLANWFFFSNFKDAIPITKSGRRYAIFYSCLQSLEDIQAAGMDDAYFVNMFAWLRTGGGLQAITHYLMHYPIERGAIPVRAPKTSSFDEALAYSRSPLEVVIADCVADQVTGFKNGYISSLQVISKAKTAGIRAPNIQTVQKCLEGMGYVSLGRATRAYFQEDQTNRAEIFASRSSMHVADYGRAQGYE